MPLMVHLADTRQTKRIRANGLHGYSDQVLTAQGPIALPAAVYCMPVLPNFVVTHQWLREMKHSSWLKRRPGAANTIVGVYFRIAGDELVWFGIYNGIHEQITISQAAQRLMHEENPLGYEVIVAHSIAASAIHKLRHLPQTTGWRYFPNAHHSKPCACDYCTGGEMKGRRLRERARKNDA